MSPSLPLPSFPCCLTFPLHLLKSRTNSPSPSISHCLTSFSHSDSRHHPFYLHRWFAEWVTVAFLHAQLWIAAHIFIILLLIDTWDPELYELAVDHICVCQSIFSPHIADTAFHKLQNKPKLHQLSVLATFPSVLMCLFPFLALSSLRTSVCFSLFSFSLTVPPPAPPREYQLVPEEISNSFTWLTLVTLCQTIFGSTACFPLRNIGSSHVYVKVKRERWALVLNVETCLVTVCINFAHSVTIYLHWMPAIAFPVWNRNWSGGYIVWSDLPPCSRIIFILYKWNNGTIASQWQCQMSIAGW